MLNLGRHEQFQNPYEWVETHRKRMLGALEKANGRLQAKAEERRVRHNRKITTDDGLDPGDLVVLRKRVKGRNKIQDIRSDVPYVVHRRCQPGSNAYIVRPADGFGVSKTVNRVDMKVCNVSNSTSGPDASSSGPDHVYADESDTSSERSSSSSPTPALRRSKRKTAGKHSNPHRLPRSTIQQTLTARSGQIDYEQLSSAVNSLGETLGKLLQQGPCQRL